MDAATRARIFEPFFTMKDVGHGSGRGLAVVRGIVAQSRRLRRVRERTGCWLHVSRLSAGRIGAGPDTPGDANAETAAPRPATILVVDNEEELRPLVTEGLEEVGYVVLAARDGNTALEAAAGHPGPIELLITDVVMPHMTGPELATRLAPARRDLIVLYVSRYTDHAAVREGVSEGEALLLHKPFTPATPLQTVRQVLPSSQ